MEKFADPCYCFITSTRKALIGKQGKKLIRFPFKRSTRPGEIGSVDWVLSHAPKGCWLDSWSGQMPRLWAQSLAVGVQKAAD